MPDNDAAAMDRHFEELSRYEPHCSYPDCEESSDPESHTHCGCGAMLPRDGECTDCLAAELNLPVRVHLVYHIGGVRHEVKSHPGIRLSEAERILTEFSTAMGHAVERHRQYAISVATRPDRVERANALLAAVATHGEFFSRNGRTAQFSIDEQGRLRYVDEWRGSRIRMDIAKNVASGRPIAFSHGAGLWYFVCRLRDFIERATPLDPLFGTHWGYGADDLASVRGRARELDMVETEEVSF